MDKPLSAARAIETAWNGRIRHQALCFDGLTTIGAIAIFIVIEPFEGGKDALAFGIAHPGLGLRHGLVLERIHAGETPDGLLVEFHGGLGVYACGVLGIEGFEAGVELGARVHGGA
ncbi:hypothetical protein GCM10007385_18180 [Tateyamaria omphalii]|nr:hypothetical protein GCM10007385_18180 [Tateyamaria omphalii]